MSNATKRRQTSIDPPPPEIPTAGDPGSVAPRGSRRNGPQQLSRHGAPVVAALVLAAAWELLGRSSAASGVFPPLSSVVTQMWVDRDLYPPNAEVTLVNAAWGFLYGNVVAVVLAVAVNLSPVFGRLVRTSLISIYCLPLIVLAPIVGVSFEGETPKVVLAAIAVLFPTYVSTDIGLRASDGALADVIRGLGGGPWVALRKLKLLWALPDMLAGLRVAAPSAILGAMLGEFLGGSRGLGVLLVATMPQAFPERLWGIGLAATAVAATSYALFAAAGAAVSARRASPTVAVRAMAPATRIGYLPEPLWAAIGIAVTLGAWVAYLKATGLPPTFAKAPSDVWTYLVSGPVAGEHRSTFVDALWVTVPRAVIGLVCGLSLAFALATLLSLSRSLTAALLPIALVSQSMPLVALTPLLVIVFGRGATTVLLITTSVTFFPSFVTVSQGLRAAPVAQTDVLGIYGASSLTVLRKVAAPGAVPHLLASARLAIPRALLGVILAEYLAVGTGIGGLILYARGRLEFTLLWTIAVVVTLLSGLAYTLVGLAERWCERRYGVR